jgi:drug/metabolite transporter (DMT)-like permease
MPRQRVVWLALGIVYVIWGSTYLAISYTVKTIPPFFGAGLRYLVAGVLMAVVLAATSGRGRLRVTGRELGSAAVVGSLLLVGGNGLVMIAEKKLPSSVAALAIASVPLFVVLLRLAAREAPPLATFGGVVLGFAGIATLLNPAGGAGASLIVAICAALSWSIGSFLSPRLAMPADAVVGTTYEMLCGGVLLLVIAPIRGELSDFSFADVSTSSWIGLGYLVVFGSLVAFTAYVWLLQNAPLATVSTYAYVNPAVAVVLGVIAGEAFTWRVAVGGVAVIVAVAIVVTTEERGRRAAAAAGAEPGPQVGVPDTETVAQCSPEASPRR